MGDVVRYMKEIYDGGRWEMSHDGTRDVVGVLNQSRQLFDEQGVEI